MGDMSEKDRERALYWKSRMDAAKDDHEVTRVYIEYRLDGLTDWLTEFDRRVAKEMREHARKTHGLIFALAGLVVLMRWL